MSNVPPAEFNPQSPEQIAVAELSRTVSDVLDASEAEFVPQEDGSQIREASNYGGITSVQETLTVDGQRQYAFRDRMGEQGDRWVGRKYWSNPVTFEEHTWAEGSDSVRSRRETHNLIMGTGEDSLLQAGFDPEILAAEDIELADAGSIAAVNNAVRDKFAPAEAGTEQQSEPVVAEAAPEEPVSQSAEEIEEARRAKIRADRAALRARAAQPARPMKKIGHEGRAERGEPRIPSAAEVHKAKADKLTGNLEWLAADESVIWEDGGKEYPHSRSTHISAPGRRDGEKLRGTVRIVDAPGKPRWYVLDFYTITTDPGRLGRPITKDVHSALLWKQGGNDVMSGIEQVENGKTGRTRASSRELDDAMYLTDPEISRAHRAKPEASPEAVAALPRSGRVAHAIGRMLGRKNVTRF